MRLALRIWGRVPIKKAIRLWRLSDTIYIGPVGPSARIMPEFELFRAIADDDQVGEAQIRDLLQHESPTVEGYAFELLIRRQAENLEAATKELANRKEEVTMGFTSFRAYSPLGEYAANRLKAEQTRGG